MLQLINQQIQIYIQLKWLNSLKQWVELLNHLIYLMLSYISGGGLGVENALKAAFDWKVRKNIAEGNGELGSKVIHFHGCFHGRTGYTLSLTNSHDPRKTMYFPQFKWPRVINSISSIPIK